MRIIGLTGGIGAGKSTASEIFRRHGARLIDVDRLGREVLESGGGAFEGVVDRFGERIVGVDGRIDRAVLAGIVFADRDELAALEGISHPAINREIDRLLDEIAARDPDALVVLDMAVLIGSRLGRDLPSGRGYDTVVVVDAPEPVRIARLVSQRGMSESDARARIAAQPTDDERRAVADHVLVNDGDLDALDRAVADLLARL